MRFTERRFSQHAQAEFRRTIEFLVHPQPDREPLRVELSPFQFSDTVIRVTDAEGQLLLESENSTQSLDCLEFLVENLEAGIYFFEVNDGFYYQVKEVHVPAA